MKLMIAQPQQLLALSSRQDCRISAPLQLQYEVSSTWFCDNNMSALTNISSNYLQTHQPVKNRQQLPRRPATDLGSPSCWSICWIQNIDINGDVDFRAMNTILESIDETLRSDLVKITSFQSPETAGFVVFDIVFLVHYRCTYASVDGGVPDEAFFVRYMEECAMIDTANAIEHVLQSTCVIYRGMTYA